MKIGETNTNFYGDEMIIVEYIRYSDIIVEFQDKNKERIRTNYNSFKDGTVSNPYSKSVFGTGFIGVGEYVCSKKSIHTHQYLCWHSMMQRCCNDKFKEKHPTYKGVAICNEWHNFQNFAKWYDENFYQVNGERMELDKDILVKGNKTYSPDSCIFVPQFINLLIRNRKSKRGHLPIGVGINGRNKKYRAQFRFRNKTKHIGYYDTIELAFNAYKTAKENTIRLVADEYRDNIPKNLYNAMYNYEIEITD